LVVRHSRRLALLTSLVCLTACADADQPLAAVVGDWFTCLDPQCSQIGGVGNRFTPAGEFVGLYPEGQVLGAQARYCVTSNPGLIYGYTWDEHELRVMDGETLLKRYSFIVEDGRAEVVNLDSGNAISMLRVTPTRTNGPCRLREPWICPKFDKRDPKPGACVMTWVCDGGTKEVSCDASGCSCEADGVAGKSFSQAGACALGLPQLAQLYAAVNAGCGWKLSLLPF